MGAATKKPIRLGEISDEVRRALALARLMKASVNNAAQDLETIPGDAVSKVVGTLFDVDYVFEGLIELLDHADRALYQPGAEAEIGAHG